MIRRDVMNLATRIAEKAMMSAPAVYEWLMALGRSVSTNPCKLQFLVIPGEVYFDSENYLEAM